MAITTLNLRGINRSDTASSGQVITATSAVAADFQAVPTGLTATAISAVKAWVKFTHTTIQDDYNVSSVSTNATGIYYINFDEDMDNIHFATAATLKGHNFANTGVEATEQAVGYTRLRSLNMSNNTSTNMHDGDGFMGVICIGDNASV